MHRPVAFNTPCVASTHLPYQLLKPFPGETPVEGGVLSSGRLVWTRSPGGSAGYDEAFVDELGTVLLDTRWLAATNRSQD